jgi:hypothetical protein
MKKILFILLLITMSCSSNDDDNNIVTGCTDPGAVNYNQEATQSGGECLYSLVGDWTASYYTLNNENVLNLFSYFDIHVYEDSSFFIEAEAIDGTYVQITGIGTYDDESNTLTLVADNGGATEVWNLTYIDSEYLYMNMTDVNGYHDTEWVKY